jgi:hypothetical protein
LIFFVDRVVNYITKTLFSTWAKFFYTLRNNFGDCLNNNFFSSNYRLLYKICNLDFNYNFNENSVFTFFFFKNIYVKTNVLLDLFMYFISFIMFNQYNTRRNNIFLYYFFNNNILRNNSQFSFYMDDKVKLALSFKYILNLINYFDFNKYTILYKNNYFVKYLVPSVRFTKNKIESQIYSNNYNWPQIYANLGAIKNVLSYYELPFLKQNKRLYFI